MRTARASWFFLMILAVNTMTTGCGGVPSGGVVVWIDAPLPGGRINPGDEVSVQTHAYSSSGITQIELVVDGEPFSRNAPDPAGGDLVTLSQPWIATSPGMHSLQVTAYSSSGAASSPAAVMIEVLGEQSSVNLPAPPQIQATTQVPTGLPTTTVQATITPTIPIASPSPTPTGTAVPPPSINFFTVDDNSITSGECTFLRWQVQYGDSVTLDGAPVGNPDARQVCPQQTTSYILRAISAGGDRSQTIQVQVSIPPPADTSGPVISNLTANPAKIFDNPSCGVDRTQVTASVRDSGSGVRRVEIFFQVVKPPTQGKSIQNGELASSIYEWIRRPGLLLLPGFCRIDPQHGSVGRRHRAVLPGGGR